MKEYIQPKIEFEELILFEKIAETCWGYQQATFDDPLTPGIDIKTLPFTGGNGCGNDQANAVIEWLRVILGSTFDLYMTKYSNNSSNLANTKAAGFNGNYLS